MNDLNKPCVYFAIGLMSGSSLDGLDIAYCCFQKKHINPEKWDHSIIIAETIPFTEEVIILLKQTTQMTSYELARFNVQFGKWMGEQVNQFIKKNDIKRLDVIGSHGHTVFHSPKEFFTLQIGHPAAIAAEVSKPVVGDFRSLDVALGGQGAPIVPIGDRQLYPEYSFCLNLGGISNITYTDPTNKHELIAYDISICNQLLNHYASQLTDKGYDEFGNFARSGQVNQDVVQKLETIEFHSLPPPKSLNNQHLTEQILPIFEEQADMTAENKLATAVEFIAEQIKKNVESVMKVYQIPQSVETQNNKIDDLKSIKSQESLENSEIQTLKTIQVESQKMLVTGGGAFNTYLMEVLQNKLTPCGVVIAKASDYEIQFKEAIVMAFLGVLRMRQEVSVLSSVTGARENSVGGCVYHK